VECNWLVICLCQLDISGSLHNDRFVSYTSSIQNLPIFAEKLIRYTEWLRAGRSGDRIPLGARLPVPVQASPGAHPASCTMGTGSFPGVKSSWGAMLAPHPILVPLVMKE
jgi:hypothetical protein